MQPSDKDVLVFSDSHGQSAFMLRTVRRYPDAGLILHLGDHCGSLAQLGDFLGKPVAGVAGNCDGADGHGLPVQRLLDICGHRIFMTHGHICGVKQQLDRLVALGAGGGNRAEIILFGHTHIHLARTVQWHDRSVLLLNPGCAGLMACRPASALLLHVGLEKISWQLLLDQI